MTRGLRTIIFCITVILGLTGFLYIANASTESGTIIDSTSYPYAWATNAGWVNFATTYGNIVVTDSKLTGYAWSQQYGWVNLAPTGSSGVTNNNEGTLSGSAWAENLGWIDFTGVVINSSGEFTGTATGDNIGTVNFDCSNCNITTDWRPASSRSANSTPSSGGGGGIIYSPTPTSYSLLINNDDLVTNSLLVKLYLKGDSNTAYVWLSEDANLVPAKRVEYQPIIGQMIYDFNLTGIEGNKIVYVKFCNIQGSCGNIISDSINYKILDNSSVITSSTVIDQKPIIIPIISDSGSDVVSDNKTITDKVTDVIKQIATKLDLLIPDFLKPWKDIKQEKLEDFRQYVSETTPLAFMGSWELLPKDPIRQYVFAPLPDEFKALAKNIPSIGKLFDSAGIEGMQDVRKLVNTKITVPSLGNVIGLSAGSLDKLSDDFKVKVPTGMVFVQSGNKLVDFSTMLSLSVDGRPVQQLKTISGKKLHLSIKPEFDAKSVKGYLTFVSRKNVISYKQDSLWQKLSLIPFVSAKEDNLLPGGIENKLVLEKFDYLDSDGDGIYTADIYSPVPEGQYEILTVIEYKDSQYGTKLVRLVIVVDPEGYVFENIKGKELRISNALVSLYWLNTQTKQYELWPANKYQQTNGQITDTRGSYSFLVPPGLYYLQASVSGYQEYKGELFKVTEGEGVHMNIELQSKRWWMIAWDWRTWIIVLLVLLLLYMIEREFKTKKEKLKL